MLTAESGVLQDVQENLVPLLQAASCPENFPVAAVLACLESCSNAGLASTHWLVFWLLNLACVGTDGRGLMVASRGAARADLLQAQPGMLRNLLHHAPPLAHRALMAYDVIAVTLQRPGSTGQLSRYLTFDYLSCSAGA